MMIDYKPRQDTLIFTDHRRHRRVALLILIIGIFCATGIYASFQVLHENPVEHNLAETAPGLSSRVRLTLPAPNSTAAFQPASQEFSRDEVSTDRVEDAPKVMSIPTVSNTEFASYTQDQLPAGEPEPASETNQNWVEEQVKSGDTLARIFSRLGLSANLLHRIIHSSKEAAKLARIKPGEKLKVLLDEERNLHELIHQQSPVKSLHITADDDGFTTKVHKRDYEIREAHVTGTITNSLYLSAREAGLPNRLIMDLANIFGWDIDFALEIRTGDSFSVIYEEKFLDGEKQMSGAILAAEFQNRGKRFRAIRFINDHGRGNYYSPDGKSMRKAFLRAPVDFRRISSKFTPSRWHPVLGRKRPHRGVDYAAATGTPIKASGDGKVKFRGRKGGYGKAVIIQHANRYTTLYGHLSKYRGSVKKGSRVKQGDIIGYVGKTGLATGPHLHYEFRVNDVHRNPLTVKLPAASPLSEKYRGAFKEQSLPLLSMLDAISNAMLAETELEQ